MKTVKMLLVTIAVSGLSGWAQAETRYYRYKNGNGELSITSTLPADKAKLGYDIIDEKGRVIESVAGELKGEELEALKEKLKEKERMKTQQEYDLSLLRRYSFVTDIEAEKQRKLTELNATLSIVKGNLGSVRSELEGEYARAAEIERQGKPLPEDLKKKIADVEAVMISTEDLYKLRQQDIKTATEDYDKAIKRFEELQILRGRQRPGS